MSNPKLLLVVLALLFFRPTLQKCCNVHYHDDYGLVCDDLTIGTPCCGVGHCNAFCCNCDHGCRNSKTPPGPAPDCVRSVCENNAAQAENLCIILASNCDGNPESCTAQGLQCGAAYRQDMANCAKCSDQDVVAEEVKEL